MATLRLPILGFSTDPDSSGNCFQEPYSIKATNDVWKHMPFIFNDSGTRIGIYGTFAVPLSYVDTANLVIVWTSTAVAGDVEWDFDYRAVGGNDTESLDQAGTQESVNANDTAPSATDERMELTQALTDGNFAAGDTVEFYMVRDGTDGGDGMAAAAQIHGLFFEFNDA